MAYNDSCSNIKCFHYTECDKMLSSDHRVTLTGNLPKDHKSLNVIITCSFTLDIYTWYEFSDLI